MRCKTDSLDNETDINPINSNIREGVRRGEGVGSGLEEGVAH